MSAKHTSGPWLKEGLLVYALEHAGWRKGVEQLQNHFCASIAGSSTTSKEELEAIARLIAAAPELLEALKALTYKDIPSNEDWAKAHAAIAKAEGEG